MHLHYPEVAGNCEVSGGQQMRSHYCAGPAIAAGVAAAGPTHKYIYIIGVARASKGRRKQMQVHHSRVGVRRVALRGDRGHYSALSVTAAG